MVNGSISLVDGGVSHADAACTGREGKEKEYHITFCWRHSLQALFSGRFLPCASSPVCKSVDSRPGLAGELSKPATEAVLLWASGGLPGNPTAPIAPFWASCDVSSLKVASQGVYVLVLFTCCRYRSCFECQAGGKDSTRRRTMPRHPTKARGVQAVNDTADYVRSDHPACLTR